MDIVSNTVCWESAMDRYRFEYPVDPENGSSVDELITDLIQSGVEAAENSAIWLSERIFDIEEGCVTLGQCLESSNSVQIWKLDHEQHILAYSFEPGIKRFRFLTVLNGASDQDLLVRAKKCLASC